MENITRPNKSEQKIAIDSSPQLASSLENLTSETVEIEIEETEEKITLPVSALRFLSQIVKAMSEGKAVSVLPIATEVTTQKAAEILGCSRPHLVKILEEGKIDFIKVGKHRRIKIEDVLAYREQTKKEQKDRLIDMMKGDEELGMYDT